MTTICRSGLFVGRKAHWKEPRMGSSLCVTDFFSVRDRRVAQTEENIIQSEIEFEIRRAAVRRANSVKLLDPLEHFVYSLISAAALASLLMGFVCMADFARQSDSEAFGQVSHALTNSAEQGGVGQTELVNTRPN
jgi:hypothetical protein